MIFTQLKNIIIKYITYYSLIFIKPFNLKSLNYRDTFIKIFLFKNPANHT